MVSREVPVDPPAGARASWWDEDAQREVVAERGTRGWVLVDELDVGEAKQDPRS